MLKKQRSFCLAVLSALFILTTAVFQSAQAEEALLRKNNFGLSYGAYSLQSPTKTFSSIGLLQLQFRRALNADISVETAFMNGVSFVGGFSSLFWGFDLGGSYALGSGFPSTQKVSDVVTILENKKFGVFVGGGLALRAIPLSAGTITYSGPYVSAQPQYYLNENVEAHIRAQFGAFVNGSVMLYSASVLFGLGMSF